jgi:hypothetical protein
MNRLAFKDKINQSMTDGNDKKKEDKTSQPLNNKINIRKVNPILMTLRNS